MKKADIGMIGLAVMGENLVVNMLDHGFRVAVFNRNTDKVRNFVEGGGKGRDVVGAYSLQELVDSLEPPRRVMMLIRAGSAVDEMLSKLTPLLEKGDIIIDGRQLEFPRHHPPHGADGGARPALCGLRRVRRRGGRAARPEPHARRIARGVALYPRYTAGPSQPRRTARPAANGWARTAPATS